MKFQFAKYYSILLFISSVLCNKNIETTKRLLHDCLMQVNSFNGSTFSTFKNCIRTYSLNVLENIISMDVIELLNGVSLIKDNSTNTLVNNRIPFRYYLHEKQNNWLLQIFEKIGRLFKSHVLRVEIANFTTSNNGVGRGKHGRMTSLFVFATLAMGMVVAPMAFKLIVLLGGKVLLLAMLIMILTGAQGLKKVATGNLNYGLYQTHAHNPCNYDRSWYYKYNNASGTDENIYPNYEINDQQYLNPTDTPIKRFQTSYMK